VSVSVWKHKFRQEGSAPAGPAGAEALRRSMLAGRHIWGGLGFWLPKNHEVEKGESEIHPSQPRDFSSPRERENVVCTGLLISRFRGSRSFELRISLLSTCTRVVQHLASK